MDVEVLYPPRFLQQRYKLLNIPSFPVAFRLSLYGCVLGYLLVTFEVVDTPTEEEVLLCPVPLHYREYSGSSFRAKAKWSELIRIGMAHVRYMCKYGFLLFKLHS